MRNSDKRKKEWTGRKRSGTMKERRCGQKNEQKLKIGSTRVGCYPRRESDSYDPPLTGQEEYSMRIARVKQVAYKQKVLGERKG